MVDGGGGRASAFAGLPSSDGLAGWLRRETGALGADSALLWIVAPCGARHVLAGEDAAGRGSGDRTEVQATRALVSGMVAHLRLGWTDPANAHDSGAAAILDRLEAPINALITRAEGYRHALVNSPLERRRRIFLNHDGLVLGVSKPAAAWLADQGALQVVGNRLTSSLPPFAKVIAALDGEQTWPRGWRIEAPGTDRQIVITAQLIGDEGARDLPFVPVIVLTVLSDEDVPREQLDGLAAAFGWTAREREIVRLLASGAALQQLADTLRISPQTATVHIRNANAKAGFRRQIDLMRLVQRA